MERKCTKCGIIQIISEFHKDSSKKDGIRPICKTCTGSQQKETRHNPEKREKRKQDQKKYLSTINEKTCIKCCLTKSVSEFYSGVPTKDGLDTKCKDCSVKYADNYRGGNKEKIAVRQKEFYDKNRDEITLKNREKRSKNIDKIIESGTEKYNKTISKVCSICNTEKDKSEFFIKYDSGDGLYPHCKKCDSERCKKYREENKDELLIKGRKYYYENKERLNERSKIYGKNNRGKSNKRNRERNKIRRQEDPNFKISLNIRNRVFCAITKRHGKTTKSAKTIELLGCSIDECRKHLESQFDKHMSWENHGFYGWHIDHIIPISLFDLTDPEQQKICFHYTNLQPLWWVDNFKKGNRLNYQI